MSVAEREQHTAELAATDERWPLFQRLAFVLRDRIRTRRWELGGVIASEQELAILYGLSSGTVRRAIEELVAEGLLERRQGSGTYVRRPHFGGLPVRFFDVTASARGAIPESRILSVKAGKAPTEAAKALDLSGDKAAVRIERLRVWPDDLVISERIYLSPALFGKLLDMPPESIGTLLYPFYETEFGVVVASAEDELSIGTADAATARLLRIEAKAPIVMITRLAYSFDNRPIEYRQSCGRADRFRFKVDAR